MTGSPRYHVERDEFGIPTIYAEDFEGLFEGHGFAVASDRLWQLEWDRRRALGTFAALTGRPRDAVADCFARRARLADSAQRGYDELDDTTRGIVDAHAAGINVYLQSMPDRPLELRTLACEPEPWLGWHCVAVFIIRHINFATWQTKLWRARVAASLGIDGLRRLSPAAMRGDVDVIVPSGVVEAIGSLDLDATLDASALADLTPLGLGLSGSNCWAVSGTHTQSGLPLIAGDPHRALEVPNVYYQVRLRCPNESIHADGFCFVGVPGIQHFGQNGAVAWGVTNAMADYQDLFVERLPDAVLERREEVVRVHGGDDITVECSVTRHGPIVVGSGDDGIGIALAATGLLNPGGSLRLIPTLLRAQTVAELDSALADWVEPVNNWVMADRAGAIAYRTAGNVPKRNPANHWLPVPGWDPRFDWDGMIPHLDLPQELNPANGFIVTANQQITTAAYPHVLGIDVAAPSRSNRIWARLNVSESIDTRVMSSIHGDDISPGGLAFARAAGHDALREWDGSMAADSPQAAIYACARDELVRRLVGRLPETLRKNPFAAWEPPGTAYPAVMRLDDCIDGWITADDRWLLAPDTTWSDELSNCIDAALAWLDDRFGNDRGMWTWGEFHRLAPFHPLADRLGDVVSPRSGPVSGADGTVMATNHVPGITYDATSGSTARYVWDLAAPAESGWVVPLGVSGDATDPHFVDQTPRYVAGNLLAVGRQ